MSLKNEFSKTVMILFILIILFNNINCRRENGIDYKTGEPVPEITLLTTTKEYDPVRYHAAYMIAEWWEQIGLRVNVLPMDFNELTSAIRKYDPENQDWQAFMYWWTGRVERADPDMFLFSINHSSQKGGVGNNFPGYNDPDYDSLAEAQRRINNPEIRRIVVHAAQEKLAEDIPFIALYYRYIIHAYRNDKWQNMTVMPGEGLYHEWIPFHAVPVENEEAEEASWLIIASNQEPDSLNPLTAGTVWEWKLLRLIYDKLARVDENFRPEPWAAESIDHIDDTCLEVILRENMIFHDGYPVRPEDVKFTYDYMINNDIPYFSAFLSPIKSVELNEKGIIRFYLHEPYAPFITMTLAQIPILPKHIWSDIDPLEMDAVPTVGSGPLKFSEWERGEYIRLSVFEDYFGAKDIEIDGIEYRLFSDTISIIQALMGNEVDMTGALLDPEYIHMIKEVPEIEMIEVPDIGFHFLGFNCMTIPFDDIILRKAASYAMDLQTIIDDLLYGYADMGGGGQSISTGNNFWKNQDIDPHVFDIEKARRILSNAGYSWNEEGYLLFP